MKPRFARPPGLELDFLRPGATARGLSLQLVLLACSVPVLVLAALQYRDALEAEQTREAALAPLLRRAFTPQQQAAASPAELRARTALQAQFRTVQAQLDYPWWSFLSFLESRQQADVALLSVEPDRRTGMLRITGQAKDVPSMVGYVAALQQSGAFEQVLLASHEVEQKRPGAPVRFELQGAWRAGYRWVPPRAEAPLEQAAPAGVLPNVPVAAPATAAKPVVETAPAGTGATMLAKEAR